MSRLVAGAVAVLVAATPCDAVLPIAELVAAEGDASSYAAPASFSGPFPDKDAAPWLPLLRPSSSKNGCGTVEVDTAGSGSGFLLLVERGKCSFEDKAVEAQNAGASGLVVYNSLEGIYQGRSFASEKEDYECSNGQGWVAPGAMASPVWDSSNTDKACEQDARCSSGVCLVTNVTDTTLGTKVCCAWDLYITMGYSDLEEARSVSIPAVFVTVADGAGLLATPALDENQLQAQLYLRPRSDLNVSSVLLWALGVATAAVASIMSADDLRRMRKEGAGGGAGGGGSSFAPEEQQALYLGMAHTLGFVVFASCTLLLLFFFDLALAVTALFAISAAAGTANIVLLPLVRLGRRLACSARGGGAGRGGDRIMDCGMLGMVSLDEAVAGLGGLLLACWWLAVRRTADYAWALQDLFGCCLCCTFLTAIRLNNIRVAAVLLCLAFVYDIFWVFLSPLLFDESVMVKVATGGEIKADPTYCEKYPRDSDCVVDSLPMLLELPRIGDFAGGYAMLGLGDIVLPGLLLAFAHRYDVSVGLPLKRGYFVYVLMGYAIGLMMANTAVYVMNMGQPALLYLVPCTLGLLVFISHRDGILPMLWAGPPSLQETRDGYGGLPGGADPGHGGGGIGGGLDSPLGAGYSSDDYHNGGYGSGYYHGRPGSPGGPNNNPSHGPNNHGGGSTNTGRGGGGHHGARGGGHPHSSFNVTRGGVARAHQNASSSSGSHHRPGGGGGSGGGSGRVRDVARSGPGPTGGGHGARDARGLAGSGGGNHPDPDLIDYDLLEYHPGVDSESYQSPRSSGHGPGGHAGGAEMGIGDCGARNRYVPPVETRTAAVTAPRALRSHGGSDGGGGSGSEMAGLKVASRVATAIGGKVAAAAALQACAVTRTPLKGSEGGGGGGDGLGSELEPLLSL